MTAAPTSDRTQPQPKPKKQQHTHAVDKKTSPQQAFPRAPTPFIKHTCPNIKSP